MTEGPTHIGGHPDGIVYQVVEDVLQRCKKERKRKNILSTVALRQTESILNLYVCVMIIYQNFTVLMNNNPTQCVYHTMNHMDGTPCTIWMAEVQ